MLWENGELKLCVCVAESERGKNVECEKGWVSLQEYDLTGAHVDFWVAHAIVSSWTIMKTFPVLSHPLPPQK